jgi:hypothetical protein
MYVCMYVCMWDELVTWGSDFVLTLFGGWIWSNTPQNALFAHLHMHFVLWRLLLCQQFVLCHNGVLHNHHAAHLRMRFCFVEVVALPTILLRHNGVLHNHHATHLHMRFCFVEVVALPTICVDAIMEYYTIIMPPTRNSVLKAQRGFPQSLTCHRISSNFERAHSQLIIHSQCWELLWKEE